MAVAARKMRSAATFSAFEYSLILPVFVLLGFARLAILCLPFRVYARFLGDQVNNHSVLPNLAGPRPTRAKRIGRMVRRTAKITPWKSLCLAQVMVASFLLRRAKIPYRVFFGLAAAATDNAPDPLNAHAWLRVGDTNLTGGQDVEIYTVVMVFEHFAEGAA
ncbi:lasso peptide biosynthesis B2 protein [Octadecabacter sp. G9-8]|uniref:Lasso peptide biosynthesis B2 protein n=1 Tax=Octadecabacter dasysiphoniae TaxID=2909341 RepID=A0ABS9CYN5_9RHOB|nr:lasso peptide biosynthesis B2 protein [Octadecabacter dasysiphoniae]MCF2872367.1 lasso peptide biosynthesis B2 protein [Octadecabacter dasysiphoniae]